MNYKLLALLFLLACCSPAPRQTQVQGVAETSWEEVLAGQMPLLGHRNWIVVTDMAYPLQTNPGITTLFADAPYADVIARVKSMIDEAPHVFAHIYQDREQGRLCEDLVPGWNDYRASVEKVLGKDEVKSVPHEELIRRLDEVSSLCRVVIIKTPLTLPYTSTFFELDCGYWDSVREEAIRRAD